MPAVGEGVKGNAKLFSTLDRAGAHFIAVSSGSSSDEESQTSTKQKNHDQEEGELVRLSECSKKASQEGEESKNKRTRTQKYRAAKPALQAELERQGNMSVRYSRVTTGDGNNSPITEAERSKRRRSQLADKISNKLHALFWGLVGGMVIYSTDFVRVCLEDERVNRLWFNIGLISFGINVVIMGYLTLWLPHVKGIKVSWNVYSPRAIPTATVVGLLCALSLNAALWNVWGFLTPLILFAVFVGCLFSLHFIPWPC